MVGIKKFGITRVAGDGQNLEVKDEVNWFRICKAEVD